MVALALPVREDYQPAAFRGFDMTDDDDPECVWLIEVRGEAMARNSDPHDPREASHRLPDIQISVVPISTLACPAGFH